MPTKTILAAAALAAALATAPAAAQTQRIAVNDLDLSTPSGVEALQQRVRAAIFRVCAQEQVQVRGNAYTMAACRRRTAAAFSRDVELAIAAAERTRLAALTR